MYLSSILLMGVRLSSYNLLICALLLKHNEAMAKPSKLVDDKPVLLLIWQAAVAGTLIVTSDMPVSTLTLVFANGCMMEDPRKPPDLVLAFL